MKRVLPWLALVILGGVGGLWLVSSGDSAPPPGDGGGAEPPKTEREAALDPSSKPSSLKPPSLACTFAPGDTLAFDLEQTSHYFVNPMALIRDNGGASAASQRSTKVLKSPLWLWRVLESTDDGWLVASMMTQPSLSVNGEDALGDVMAGFGRPLLFTMQSNCTLGEVGATSDILPAVALEQHMVLKNAEMHVRDEGTQWTAQQGDTLGRYTARYTQRHDIVVREKQRYVEVTSPDPNVTLKAKLLSAKAEGQFDPEGRWFKTLAVEERVVVVGPSGTFADVATTAKLKRAPTPAGHPFFSMVIDPSTFTFTPADKVVQSASGKRYDRPVIPGLRERTLASVVDEFAGLLATHDNRLFDQALRLMVQFLRLDPANITALMASLRSGGIPAHAQSMSFLALEIAGGDAAHDALLAATEDSGLSLMNRLRAVSAFGDARDADDSFVDRMVGVIQKAEARGDQDMRGASVLALGALGANKALSGEAQGRVSELLLDTLDKAEDMTELTTAIGALGNRNDGDTASKLTAHLESEHEAVRSAAYDALRTLDQLPEVQTMLTSLVEEESQAVRARISDGLLEMTAGMVPADYLAAIQQLSSPAAQQDTTIRGTLIDILGSAVDDIPETRQALIALFKGEKEADLLKKIGQYVSALDLQ